MVWYVPLSPQSRPVVSRTVILIAPCPSRAVSGQMAIIAHPCPVSDMPLPIAHAR